MRTVTAVSRALDAAIGLTLLVFAALQSAVAANDLNPAQVNAVLVYNFLRFIDWPSESSKGPLMMCVAGADSDFASAFSDMDGRTVNDRVVKVHLLANLDNAAICHVLYIHNSAAHTMLSQLRESHNNLLTMGDSEGFVEEGGGFGLVSVAGRQKFKINQDVLLRGRYQVSAQLLKLALNAP